jgi:hypothetical protein
MSYEWQGRRRDGGDRRGRAIFGGLLVLVGLFFLVSEQFGADLSTYGWPIWVIGPGVILLILGLAIPHEGGLGAAIPGGLLTAVGLVLAFQYATNAYGSWAYMWAIVAPGSVGVTLLLFGLIHRRGDLIDAGLRTAATGLGLFVGFGLFFENILAIDDTYQTTVLRDAFPLLAVGLGVVIVIWNLLPKRPASGPEPWTPTDPPTPPSGPTQTRGSGLRGRHFRRLWSAVRAQR